MKYYFLKHHLLMLLFNKQNKLMRISSSKHTLDLFNSPKSYISFILKLLFFVININIYFILLALREETDRFISSWIIDILFLTNYNI